MPTASISVFRSILHGLGHLGLDYEDLLARIGVADSWIDDLDKRLSCELALALIDEAQAASGDPDFGLKLGQKIHPSTMGIAGYLLLTASTFKEGLLSYCRYQRVFGDGLLLSIRDTISTVRVVFDVHPDLRKAPSCHVQVCSIAAILRMARACLGDDLSPTKVSFTHPAPLNVAPYHEYFGSSLCFNATESFLEFERQRLEQPLLQANPALFRVCCHQAEQLLLQDGACPSYRERVRTVILQLLNGEYLSLKRVAAKLDLNARTLQRRLKNDATSFQEILDEVRKNAAVHHLAQGMLSVDELGYLLGFSEPSAFRKAFRKWTGSTPSEFRKRLSVASGLSNRERRRIDPPPTTQHGLDRGRVQSSTAGGQRGKRIKFNNYHAASAGGKTIDGDMRTLKLARARRAV